MSFLPASGRNLFLCAWLLWEIVEMLLAIDIGNSHIVFGVFEGEKLVGEFRVATQLHKTADEYGILLKSLLLDKNVATDQINGAIIASVVPALTEVFETLIQTGFSIAPLKVTHQLQTGITIQYDRPEQVGADRIVNAAAAFHLFGGKKQPLIIVDFGTATTFDVVSDHGDYLGGAIAPGLVVSAEALSSHTAKLPRVELTAPKNVIGKETSESIRSGIVFGHVGLVNEIISRASLELNQSPQVIATGGLSGLLAPLCKIISIVRPTLTLEGLMIIYQKNRLI
jgi:type III pantothenate kinase